MSQKLADFIQNAFYGATVWNPELAMLPYKEYSNIVRKALTDIIKGLDDSDKEADKLHKILNKKPVKKVVKKVSKVVKKKPVKKTVGIKTIKHYTKWKSH